MNRRTVFALLLTLVCWPLAAAEPRKIGRTRQELIQELETGGGHEQVHAAWALSQLAASDAGMANPTACLDDLHRLAGHERATIRYWGLVGLGQLLARLAADHPLRETAARGLTDNLADRSPAARLAAAQALAQAGRPRQALPVVVEAMKSPQESVRIQAVAVLERLGPAARPARDTLEAATTDSSEYVKRISTRALEHLDP